MRPRSRPAAPHLALPPAVILAALSGGITAAAFPGLGWWPLVVPGTALLLFTLLGRSIGGALLVGLVGGFSFWGTHIFWLTVYLGPIPWLALAGLQTVFFALGCVLLALAWRCLPRLWPGPWGSFLGVPLVLAGLWVLRESIASVWPYGGFSWGRLAFSQSESPLAPLTAWLGISGLSFVLAALAALLVQALRIRGAWTRSGRGLIALVPLLAILLVPAWPGDRTGSIRVAGVQGDSEAGLFARHVAGQFLNDHLDATAPLFGQRVDAVIWPENASDLNPLEFDAAARALDYVTQNMDAPLVTGTITEDAEGRTFNSLLLWEAGKGAVDQYDKIHPVPFAEYLPDRAFWYPLAPALFDLVPRDYSEGTRDNIFDLGEVPAGVAICFDIVDDALVAQMIDDGAQVIVAPTNNADFGRTDESVQQLAIARLRAIEAHRSVVQVSTVGTSAIIAPDGRTIDRLPTFEPGAMVADVPLSTTITPALFLGRSIEWAAGALSATALGLGLALGRRGRRP
jgi:apolipoprotein N-acyltransferase